MYLPQLGRVPSIHQSHLAVKVTQTGVTYLIKTKYRGRYTGSKNCAVDINGNLYLKRSDLKKALESEGKKNGPAATAKPIKSVDVIQNSANFSTTQNNLSTNNSELSTPPAFKGYKINKGEVRHR
jgi:hypothetical protein